MSDTNPGSSAGPSNSPLIPLGFVSGVRTLESRHIDEAAESAITETELNESSANVIRQLLAVDSGSIVAQSYYDHINARGTARLRTRMRRAAIQIDYHLSDNQLSLLTDYAPEYELTFGNTQIHDHPMAAAMRMLDHHIINSRVPANARVTDVGGDAVFHIRNGHTNVHCCDPIEDVKDASRLTARNLIVKTMLEEKRYSTAETKLMLDSYVSGLDTHFCNRKAQKCSIKADTITSVHVYDVPMADWPAIMEKKGASVVEGALIFSNKFFDLREGELPSSGVRYCIDVESDRFKMGFIDSPSWWYSHKWSEFLRYGIDQRIVYGRNVYAYKIVERRHDTIYFRILAVDKLASDAVSWKREISYSYVYPSVQMVEVDGFSFDSIGRDTTRSVMTRKKFSVAKPLWDSLVNTASLDYERGSLDFQRMFNHYRTVAPRHTINGIVISGGYTVDHDLLSLVVIHASIVGAMRVSLTDKENRGITEEVFRLRASKAQSTALKIGKALASVLTLPFYSTLYCTGVRHLCDALQNFLEDRFLTNFVKVNISPIVRTVSVDMIFREVDKPKAQIQLDGSGDDFSKISADSILHDLVDSASADPDLASYLLECMSNELGEFNVKRLDTAVRQKRKEIAPEPVVAASATNVGAERHEDKNWSSATEKRRAAIQEAIVEIVEENKIILATCKRMYSEFLTPLNQPNAVAIKRNQEADGNPDLWQVRRGVLMPHSVCNKLPVRDFNYAVAYMPNAAHDSSSFVTVDKFQWQHHTTGEIEINFMVPDTEYTGYILVCDSLQVFNGEAILASLTEALGLEHEYSVKLNEGPPGCGKTYSIIQEYREGDMVLCPVKESSVDTQLRLKELYPDRSRTIEDVVRTVDSFLMHRLRQKSVSIDFQKILADECFMTHAGKWYAAAALLGVKEISAYGDTMQIPHIPRVQVPKEHVRLEYNTRVFNPVTRRCPADSVAAWADLYGNMVRSTNTITKSLKEVNSCKMVTVAKDTCLMGMYQSDKKEIRKLFPHHEVDKGRKLIVTAHEAEGKTYREVILFRFDRRVRKDKLSLYDQTAHVLVAISRHTEKFTYVRADGLGDLVSKMIGKSRNPRRIQAILDVSKAGKEYD